MSEWMAPKFVNNLTVLNCIAVLDCCTELLAFNRVFTFITFLYVHACRIVLVMFHLMLNVEPLTYVNFTCIVILLREPALAICFYLFAGSFLSKYISMFRNLK